MRFAGYAKPIKHRNACRRRSFHPSNPHDGFRKSSTRPTKSLHERVPLPMKNMLNGAQVIVDYLVREKVPQVFGLCGHGNIQFLDALYERSHDIQTLSVHHETVAEIGR